MLRPIRKMWPARSGRGVAGEAGGSGSIGCSSCCIQKKRSTMPGQFKAQGLQRNPDGKNVAERFSCTARVSLTPHHPPANHVDRGDWDRLLAGGGGKGSLLKKLSRINWRFFLSPGAFGKGGCEIGGRDGDGCWAGRQRGRVIGRFSRKEGLGGVPLQSALRGGENVGQNESSSTHSVFISKKKFSLKGGDNDRDGAPRPS